MAQTNVSELLDFTGGINNVKAPHLLPLNESLDLTNVDISFGSLKSVVALAHGKAAQGAHFYEYKDTVYFYNEWRANALLDDKLYWTNGVNQGKILPDGSELPLGIETPALQPTCVVAGATGAGTHNGDYKYTYTYYSTDTGVESAPAALSAYISPDVQNITISGFSSLPATADKYRIYRVGGYLAKFTMVAEVTAAEVPYTDALDETQIDGRLLQTLRTAPPSPNIKNFVELNGRLYGSIGSKVYYSGLGNPDSWYSDDFFTMPDTVIALGKSAAGVIIFGKTYTYMLYGTSPQSFRLHIISDYLGCIKPESIAYYNDVLIFLGVDGVYAISGSSIENLTYNKIREIKGLNVSSAAVANNVYYIAYKPAMFPALDRLPSNTLYPGGTKGTGEDDSSQGIIAMDFRHGVKYSYHTLAYDATVSVGLSNGILNTVQYSPKLSILSTDTFKCDDVFCYGDYTLVPIEGTDSDVFKQLTYKSPQLIDGSYSTLKQYEKVRINFIGEFNIQVISSDKEIMVEDNISSDNNIVTNIDLDTNKDSVATIGIPNNNNLSYSIMFKITGKGIIKSIQYSWKTRELA